MAKEKAADKSELSKEERRALKQAKKDKKEAKSQLLVADAGVSKSKSDKKEKKEKNARREALAEKALNEITKKKDESSDEEEQEGEEGEESEVEEEVVVKDKKGKDKKETPVSKMMSRPVGALVPFANPLVDEKVAKKVFKGVKKAAANRTLKRGVKEVVKAIRRSPTTATSEPTGVVVLAADISPMDVISHIPVLCEDHHIPYVYVTSRAELGMAGQTKRPTSVVMVGSELGKKKEDGEEHWAETYKGLVKVVEREGKNVRV